MDHPLVAKDYLLEKYPGKGGWVYARIPEIRPDKHAHFGWVRVKGTIDSYAFGGYHLMPMGNGDLFLPIKSALRKKMGKGPGDTIRVVLFADPVPEEPPEAFLECLQSEPEALSAFEACSDLARKELITWLWNARGEAESIRRMADAITRLLDGTVWDAQKKKK
ncbi:MAG: YdeI/OmpD-associated family protein [Marinilabiliales bacterium]|nr:YdeI/OmpD-associated family protein [Marinilabiliales bacterium]